MRTTVVLNDELVAEAKEVLGGSLRSMIEASLREAIQTRRRENLLRALETGELELTFTAEDLREWRRDRYVVDAGAPPDADAPGEPHGDSARRQAAGG